MTTTQPVERASTPAELLDRRDARPLRRASARLRPREPLLRRGLRRAAAPRASSTSPSRPSSAAPGPRLDEYSQLLRRLALPRPGHRAGRQHALLLDRRRRRPAAGRRRLVPLHPREGGRRRGASPPSTARPATTCRCCCRAPRPSGSTAAGRSAGTRSSAASRRCGRYGGFHAMDTSDPAGPADRPRLPAPRHRGRSRSSRRGTRSACGRRRARTPCSTRRSCPTSWSPSSARPASPAPGCSTSAIFAWALLGLRVGLPRRGQAGVRHDGRADAAADVDRADQLDGPPPRGPAPRRRDAHGLRRRRGAARAHDAPTGRTGVDHADWPVRLVGTRQFVINQAYDIVDRALDLTGGAGVVQAQPPRADLPRRADGPLPPGQHAARPRADRQAVPRRRPRRSPALGLTSDGEENHHEFKRSSTVAAATGLLGWWRRLPPMPTTVSAGAGGDDAGDVRQRVGVGQHDRPRRCAVRDRPQRRQRAARRPADRRGDHLRRRSAAAGVGRRRGDGRRLHRPHGVRARHDGRRRHRRRRPHR